MSSELELAVAGSCCVFLSFLVLCLQVAGRLSNERFRGKSSYDIHAQTALPITDETSFASEFQLNAERVGKVTLRVSSLDKPQLGYALLFPVLGWINQKLSRKT